jgi:hypothetical protein
MRCRYSTILLPVSPADIAIDLGVCFRPLPREPIHPGPAALQERGDRQLGVEPVQFAPDRCGKFKVIAAAYDDFHGASVSARHSSARQSSRGAVVPWSRAGSFRRRSLFGDALVGAPSAMTVRFWNPRKVRRRVLTRRRSSLLRERPARDSQATPCRVVAGCASAFNEALLKPGGIETPSGRYSTMHAGAFVSEKTFIRERP